jgi:diphosphomevalonate decarboxylase
MPSPSPTAVTYEAPPNIALVKYWGVRDRERGLPFNSSFSVTLGELRSRTSVRFDPTLDDDAVVLNGEEAAEGPRDGVVRFLDRVREIAGWDDRAEVESSNNFPIASGLASSASGFAALAGAATRAAGLTLSDRELSDLARLGSGSACRSVFGGFVEWQAGTQSDGSDCFARSVYGPDHWPELVDLVVLVHGAPTKEVRSADAMQSSVRTSDYYAERQREIPERLARIRAAIGERRADRLFPPVMEECDSFRKVCETSRPSLDYLTSTSRSVLDAVRAANRRASSPIAAYTHDAGAHVHVFTLQRHLARLRRELSDLDGVDRVFVVRPGPGARPEGAPRSVPASPKAKARAGRSRATAARGRSKRSSR